jgi:succinate dehydrogenase flavin-adding protein (antitoxin of CptAB toxin-antitoxin module)
VLAGEKCDGDIRDWGYRLIPFLAVGLLVFLIVVFAYALAENLRVISRWLEQPNLFVFPAIGIVAALVAAVSVRSRRDGVPYYMVALIFAAAFGTLAISFWPYMIPFSITIEEGCGAPFNARLHVLGRRPLRLPADARLYRRQLRRVPRQAQIDGRPLLNGRATMSESRGATGSQNDDPDIRRRRLLFRCWHRGTQEVDLIFGAFAETSLAGFSADQLDRFADLLDCADADLFDWVTGRSTPSPAHDHGEMRLLRSLLSGQTRADFHQVLPCLTRPGTAAA